MKLTIQDIADKLNGKVVGDNSIEITQPSKIEEGKQGSISFLANPKYEDFLYSTNASVVLVSNKLELREQPETNLILVDDPYSSFVLVLNEFSQSVYAYKGIHESAIVESSATIGENVTIGANAYIGANAVLKDGAYIMANAFIGDSSIIGQNTIIHPNTTIYHFCEIGSGCIIHSGTVIGSDGFGFAPNQEGVYAKVPQVGNVVIKNDVEIGANVTIDRATMGSTIIGNGVKIDNLVQIAHNVVIDDHTVIAAQAGISGSTKLGKHIIVGGQAGFVGHITIANGTKINAQSGISKSIKEEGTAVSGSPAFNWKDELRANAVFRKLPELMKRIQDLENQLKKNNA